MDICEYLRGLSNPHFCYRLEFRRVKGSSNPRLCYFPPDRQDSRCFLPTGVVLVKTVKGLLCGVIYTKSTTRLY